MVWIRGYNSKGIPFFPIVPPTHTHTFLLSIVALFTVPLLLLIVPLFHCHCPLCKHQTWFCTFWLENVLCATVPCNFATYEIEKCFCHHSSVQFLISAFTTWLRTRRFNKPTFGLTRHTNHWKNTAFRNFSNNMGNPCSPTFSGEQQELARVLQLRSLCCKANVIGDCISL